ncbi:Uma2 family endonuclease [Anabaena aphanizomenioides LEGE 00250]|uniref:Uma2 family endonuclease n=1 Tax=Sphaerospermopsis aphanizomenoides LEGE 00250 TaxID=2777972 RepID=A0ABR9VIA2_9CYAN|nr:Uma2 family endonuclease [Sphaerospermopsis aphanizomenoides]MBE9238222.1 Uma2 family endonuclease [Sphaerospermopsis aphanizomenoides LEGE 00250]
MLNYNPLHCLPSSEELPDSDETPVDNQLQHLIPGLLESILALIWSQRWDWFFGVDMGIYYDPNQPAIVPDGFLSIGIPRVIHEKLRSSYVLWEEQKLPSLVLEVVSQTYRNEYSTKKEFYADDLGILYYVVYNPQRKIKETLEVYKLVDGEYILIPGNPVWLPEIGLGIGKEKGTYQGITREWLYWFDENGKRFLTPEERIQQSEEKRNQAEEKAKKLAEMLKNLGVDPESLI